MELPPNSDWLRHLQVPFSAWKGSASYFHRLHRQNRDGYTSHCLSIPYGKTCFVHIGAPAIIMSLNPLAQWQLHGFRNLVSASISPVVWVRGGALLRAITACCALALIWSLWTDSLNAVSTAPLHISKIKVCCVGPVSSPILRRTLRAFFPHCRWNCADWEPLANPIQNWDFVLSMWFGFESSLKKLDLDGLSSLYSPSSGARDRIGSSALDEVFSVLFSIALTAPSANFMVEGNENKTATQQSTVLSGASIASTDSCCYIFLKNVNVFWNGIVFRETLAVSRPDSEP